MGTSKYKKIFLLFAIFLFLVIGDLSAETSSILRPVSDGTDDSGNWINTASTACNSTDCYLEVDESSGGSCTNSDGDTSYIQSGTNGAVQTFDIDISSIPNYTIITGINITVCAVWGEGGAKLQTRRCVDGSCTSYGTNIDLVASYMETTQSHSGLSISKRDSTNIEIGVENTAAKTSRVSQISALVTYTIPDDTFAPAEISDLVTSNPGDNTMQLSWTSPGDNGSEGTATSYDVRYSRTAIVTDDDFNNAMQATGEPTPSAAGSSESMTVTGLSAGRTYYFAIKTSDEVPNTSDLSNVPTGATTGTPDDTAPTAITDLLASNPTHYSIDLSWTATGNDGSTGTAVSYDVRYSTLGITDANWDFATQVTNEPTPSVAGSSESMTVSGLNKSTTYYFALKTSDELPNVSDLSNVINFTTVELSGAGTGVEPTEVSFSGQSFPDSTMEVLRKSRLDKFFRNTPVEEYQILPSGQFFLNYSGLLTDSYIFALRAVDQEGNKTGIKSYNIDLNSKDAWKIDDIVFPPTISLGKDRFYRNENVELFGYAALGAQVEIELDEEIIDIVLVEENGKWIFSKPASSFESGEHVLRVRQQSLLGEVGFSDFSYLKKFSVLSYSLGGGDFNNDLLVDISDWSIFLFRWGSENDELRNTIDLNNDNQIDITDFSIFLRSFSN